MTKKLPGGKERKRLNLKNHLHQTQTISEPYPANLAAILTQLTAQTELPQDVITGTALALYGFFGGSYHSIPVSELNKNGDEKKLAAYLFCTVKACSLGNDAEANNYMRALSSTAITYGLFHGKHC